MEEIKFKEEVDASLLSKFLDDMLPTRLSWQSPREKYGFGVFWSAEKSTNYTSTYLDHHFSINDRIKTTLLAFQSYYNREVLIHYWAATTVAEGGQRLLTTSDQPFAINYLPDEKLIQYKKDCPKYKFVGEGEEDHNLTDDAPVSRVFRRQFPEMSPDLSYYSVKEYPERDLALGCGFKATLVLPVFEPTLQCCVGVLELLFTKYLELLLLDYFDSARKMLQAAGLDTINAEQLRDHIREKHLVGVKTELKRAMAQVSKTHGLPHVCFWARCEHISSLDRGGSLSRSYNACDVNCRGELAVSLPEMMVIDYKHVTSYGYKYSFSLPIRVGQGHVGKVFHADKPCLCRDVTQISITDNPLAHIGHSSKLIGRFAVCLQSITTGFRAYVLEFFLPPDKSHSGDLHNFLSSILTILKQHLKTFKVVTGDIGNDLFTEIGYLNESNVEANNTSFTYNTLSTSSGHETTNSSREFTSYHTISSLNIYSDYKTISLSGDFTSIKTKAEDSARSLRSRSIESTMNSTRRKLKNYTGPSGNRSYLDQSPSKINEPVDSETGSSYCIKLFGHVMSVNQYQVPTINECRGDSSLSDAPRSEGSAAVARTIPPWTMVDVEMVDVETVNGNDDEEL